MIKERQEERRRERSEKRREGYERKERYRVGEREKKEGEREKGPGITTMKCSKTHLQIFLVRTSTALGYSLK